MPVISFMLVASAGAGASTWRIRRFRGRLARLLPTRCIARAAAPMGFAASASWAQGFNEVVAEDAALPPSRRVVADLPCPGRFPVRASILDDCWILEEETVDDSAPWGQMLLGRVGVCWDTLGLATNVKKDVLGDLPGEVQGAFIHGRVLARLVTSEARATTSQAGLHVLSRRYVRVRTMQHFIGKSGFGQYFRSCCRPVYDRIYSWVQHHERQRRTGGVLWESVRSEILATLSLLPTMQFSFITPFCERVESSDASPGGHGRAWTRMDQGRVQTICRLAEGRGVYTNVDLRRVWPGSRRCSALPHETSSHSC